MFFFFLKLAGFIFAINIVIFIGLLLFRQSKLSLLTLNLFLITTLFTIISAEYMTRFIFRDITTTSDGQSFFSRQWYEKYLRTNHFGFRERNFDTSRPANTDRISVIGDSFTFGQGILEEDRYTNRLEVLLNRTPKLPNQKYQVLNFAKPGTDTIDHVDFLKNYVLKSDPNLVILQFYINDFENSKRGDRPAAKMFLHQFKFHEDLAINSAFYFLINQFWNNLQIQYAHLVNYQNYMKSNFTSENSKPYREWERTMRAFIETCQNAKVPLLIVLFPSLDTLSQASYNFQFLHDHVYRLCSEYGVDYYDLTPDFQSVPDPRKAYRLNRFDSHANVQANLLASKKIYQVLDAKFSSAFSVTRSGNHEISVTPQNIATSYSYLNQTKQR